MYDVIVVGGGPAGSRVAYGLADRGFKVLVLEREKITGGKTCCTGIIGQECASLFAVDDGVILRRLNSANLFAPSGNSIRLWREQPQACVVDRSAFDRLMAERAQAKGAEYRFGCQAENINFFGNGVEVKASSKDDNSSFKARAVVLATGFNSPLVKKFELGKVGDFVLGAQAEVETDVEEVEVYFGRETAPGFFAWLVPTSSQRALAGLLSRRRPGFYLTKFLSWLAAQGKIASVDVEIHLGGIPLKPLPKTYGERLLVVGDAAGQVKPTTGGGIYYGLLCADIAVNALDRALENNDLSAGNLAVYEKGWRKKLGRELAIGYYARKLYERFADCQIDSIFNLIKSSGIDEMLSTAGDLSFDWHGKVILRLLPLLGQRAFRKAIRTIGSPFSIPSSSS